MPPASLPAMAVTTPGPSAASSSHSLLGFFSAGIWAGSAPPSTASADTARAGALPSPPAFVILKLPHSRCARAGRSSRFLTIMAYLPA